MNVSPTSSPNPIIVYPIRKGGSPWNNNELRHSLRSVAKYWKSPDGNPPKVFVLTVENLPWLSDQVTVVKVDRYTDCILTAMELARTESPTGDYVWMNDDIFFLKDTTPKDLLPCRYLREMKPYQGEVSNNGWRRKLYAVRDTLADYGWSTMNYSTHLPYLFNADRMEMTIGLFGLTYKNPLELAYFNMWAFELGGGQKTPDRLLRHSDKWIPGDLENKRFLNVNNRGLSHFLKGVIKGYFPNKCIYERTDKTLERITP